MKHTTLVFTDIEDSTRLWERHPETFLDVLQKHDAMVLEALAAAGGREVKRLGDGLFLTLAKPQSALEFAIAVQRRVAEAEWAQLGRGDSLRIRIGIHYGDPHNLEDDLLGLPVNRAARLCAAAHGGQTLVSEGARREIGSDLPADYSLDHLGAFRLRGFSRFENVYQLNAGRQKSPFPPLKACAITLPPERTTFIGREEILSFIERLLVNGETPLVTLTGIGGMGKSRTALHIAHRLRSRFEGGIYFVELAPLTSCSEVVPLLHHVLGAVGQPDDDGFQLINDLLDGQPTLIVLDNLEHLDGIERVVASLIDACPTVRILATSRVVLQTWHQQEVELPPLDIPDTGDSLAAIRRCKSVQMFVKRAQNFDRTFRLTELNSPAVVEICRITSGIPLAIELSSQMIQAYEPAAIASRLQGKLLEIRARTPDLPERLSSLRTAFEYSYQLLAEEPRELLSSLLVFRGGFTSEAVEAVCAGDIDDFEAAWTGLLDHRWVERTRDRGARRYRLLEPVAEFVREKAGVPRDELFKAHADYYLQVAQDIDTRFRRREIVDSFHHLREELANFRAVLRWACNTADHGVAARLGAYLSNALLDSGLWQEFDSWVGLSIRSAEIIGNGPVLSQLLTIKGLMAERRGDQAAALSCFNSSLQHAGDSERDMLRAHVNLARMSQEIGDKSRCEYHAGQVILIAPRCDMRADAGLGCMFLASIKEVEGDNQGAGRLWNEARAGFEIDRDEWSLAHWDRERGRTKERIGDLPAAQRYYGASLRRYSRLGLTSQLTAVLGRIATVAVQQNAFQLCARALVVADRLSGNLYTEVKVLAEVARELRTRVGESVCRQLLEEAAGARLQDVLDGLDSVQGDSDEPLAVAREPVHRDITNVTPN